MEIQFCRLPSDTAIEKLVSVDTITHWHNDSLYVKDENLFYSEYSNIFNCGIYNNLKRGIVDIYGINYYPHELPQDLTEKIVKAEPTDFESLVSWLKKAKEYNGFYILGI